MRPPNLFSNGGNMKFCKGVMPIWLLVALEIARCAIPALSQHFKDKSTESEEEE